MDQLKLRNERKRKKPVFRRQYSNVMKQFGDKWNRPRGMHSKMRRGIRGKKLLPTVGFRSPTDARGLTRTGLVVFVVTSISDLQRVNPKEHAVFLASGLGMRKRVEIAKKAIEMKINLENVKDVQKFIDESKKSVDERKKKSSDRKNKKDKKKEEKKESSEKEKEQKEDKAEKKAENKVDETQEKSKISRGTKEQGSLSESDKKIETKPTENKKTENTEVNK